MGNDIKYIEFNAIKDKDLYHCFINKEEIWEEITIEFLDGPLKGKVFKIPVEIE